jgi:predicted DsbA family dithiol-disulfide isomerase
LRLLRADLESAMKSVGRMRIDFVSDVSCPWCAIALNALEAALARFGPQIETELHFQPFELNPHMGPGGQNIVEHLSEKYGSPAGEIERAQELIRARGVEVGFTFDLPRRTRIYNTFDAHRLLHWAGLEGKQRALKHALFAAYFTAGRDPSDRDVLLDVAGRVGLDASRAKEILSSDEYAAEVRAREQFYQDRGISAVPAVIFNERYLVQGGQPVEVFEELVKRYAAEPPTSQPSIPGARS